MFTSVQKVEQEKRVVLLHTQGPWKGMKQILGTSAEFNGQLPVTTPEFNMAPDNRVNCANLVKMKIRYALYRESDLVETAGKSFHPAQQ